MVRKENQRITLTRRLLQEGLLRLLRTEKLEDISVTALCKEAGINRATFYNHYTSPHDLLNNVEDKLAENLRVIVGDPKTATDALTRTEAVCNFLYENAHTVLALHNCHADQRLLSALYEMNKTFQSYRIKERYVQSVSPVAIHLIAFFFHSGCYSIMLEWLQNDIPATPKQMAELMLALARENFLE